MENKIEIQSLSEIELMELISDTNAQLQYLQQNLQALNGEWVKRVEAHKKGKEPNKPSLKK
jgi:hypothetical protein